MPLTGDYLPSPTRWVRDQVAVVESSGGTEGTVLHGAPIIIITNRGRTTGALRKIPVMRVEHDGRYLAVASYGGSTRHPRWYHNLRHHPHVEVQDGTRKQDMRARELTGAEKTTWWHRAVDVFPQYADYQAKTDRDIPVFLLEPLT
ncbi:nitroreductase family deazaflavin-dependent oxidoreductase [Saccharopolyspora sp. 6V]|uniref:nitroreductase family deazaflavin-dependent oxidoreductase n=2 Tax=unclassified Saccharopolyspora TaxID=2646250 RepID=UPI001CD22D48|nr:nitroreductase family deazaflavin-dependent oxidoreductase [Saccharopolyspora sp. 6V]MCA1195737.1 nitroreductase family deazaflavin-dependent oxidoreductase [Saccharopolyspora sp. 6V]